MIWTSRQEVWGLEARPRSLQSLFSFFFLLPITDWITKKVSARKDKSNPDNPVDRYECLDSHVKDDDLVALVLSLTPTDADKLHLPVLPVLSQLTQWVDIYLSVEFVITSQATDADMKESKAQTLERPQRIIDLVNSIIKAVQLKLVRSLQLTFV